MYTTSTLIGQYHFPALAGLAIVTFYKTNTKWFSMQDIVIQTLGMLLDFWKAKQSLFIEIPSTQ